ncbi:MAG: UPF0175 family protein [Thermoguttaceae bacterium]|nr:UPF0175 family protein [Thermoguttaceae bacterium]
MKTVKVQVTVPEEMEPYLNGVEPELSFEQNAMLLYPYVGRAVVSYGRAAEILGVSKWDLIEFYNSIGIPYLNQSKEELLADLAALDKVLAVAK